jgi:methylated-DNA-[protein]-cysteine S-methyltransferase
MIGNIYSPPGGFNMSLSSYAPKSELTHTVWKSPFGSLGLVKRGERLAQISLNADPVSFPFEVERNFGSVGRKTGAPFEEVCQEIEEYLAGRRLVFRLKLDIDQGTPFQKRVWKALMAIPYGQTMTYRDVAVAIGQPSAMRAVGSANGMNPLPIVIPCHRVVASDGLGGYSGGIEIKRRLLELEANTRARVAQLGMFSRKSYGTFPSRP